MHGKEGLKGRKLLARNLVSMLKPGLAYTLWLL